MLQSIAFWQQERAKRWDLHQELEILQRFHIVTRETKLGGLAARAQTSLLRTVTHKKRYSQRL
jgi:hypothetical protein